MGVSPSRYAPRMAKHCSGRSHILGPTKFPTPDILQDLKTLTMIINETLRLYPPAMTLNRDILRRAKLGNLDIPAGTQLHLSVVAMHHDIETWGNDAEEFNPRRFEDPKKQSALLVPFGLGPRYCVGQNFAMVEVKTVLVLILKHYSFRLSPSYVHAPVMHVTLQPQHGAHLLFSRIKETTKIGWYYGFLRFRWDLIIQCTSQFGIIKRGKTVKANYYTNQFPHYLTYLLPPEDSAA